MAKTSIEWCEYTLNPIVGCSKCSPGCASCFAERFAARLAKNPITAKKYAGIVDEKGKWTGKISEWDYTAFSKLPKKSSRVFVGSMTDIFHENVLERDLVGIMLEIYKRPQHIFMFLTKRPKRMKTFISDPFHLVNESKPLPNLWLGVTVCNQQEADEKIPILLKTPAAKRFVSVEPCLSEINLTNLDSETCDVKDWCWINALTGEQDDMGRPCPSVPKLDWVIVGGETGPSARPMHPDWARSLRDQCQAAAVPFFFKQMSGRQETPDDLKIREFPECISTH